MLIRSTGLIVMVGRENSSAGFLAELFLKGRFLSMEKCSAKNKNFIYKVLIFSQK